MQRIFTPLIGDNPLYAHKSEWILDDDDDGSEKNDDDDDADDDDDDNEDGDGLFLKRAGNFTRLALVCSGKG